MPGPLWIPEGDVEALLDLVALVDAIEAGFTGAPFREPGALRMDGLDRADSYLTLFPAHAPGGFASVKLLAGRPANARQGLPEIDAVVALVDPSAGRIVALLSARALTALRTAAVTVAVLRRLVPKFPARIGLVGTGAQARAHLRLLSALGLAELCLIASPQGAAERAEALAEHARNAFGLEVRAAPLTEVAAGAEALILMTLAKSPPEIGLLPPDCVVASIGTFYPDAFEIDPALLERAAIVVSDDPERLSRQWTGSPRVAFGRVALAAAADLLRGDVRPPASGLRIFLSDGRAFEDNVAARLVYRAALAGGHGVALA